MTRIIHGISRELLRAAFCDYFGVADEHADILVLLYERPGTMILTRDLAKLLNSHRPPTKGAIQERIRFLREIMEAESLDTGEDDESSGYALSDIGVNECVKALREMAEALMKCGPSTMLAGRNVEQIRRSETSHPLRAVAGQR
ncbi:hypothetical protein [Phenylobacterium soli]|uniref:Uncharacterized protein n=1 Tax=Phenylobacterium soli TaxID=2170551 RepID=A0A328AA58_9CAUL|nr:hypothetical protein [Phenylobacterium soli]RAK51603.1 hypothetical protein DJ017_17355 [Phenylobacterium soli]